ncbi:hypothetical protein [Deinococcus aerophilus]|uniref:hypothetical protein n=1 Tax=Deinococcus aerophilus TaxID=522488 RepID=UPI001664CF84|nr:hypothetical protein [Deinococcus aerophilus]
MPAAPNTVGSGVKSPTSAALDEDLPGEVVSGTTPVPSVVSPNEVLPGEPVGQ